MPKYDDFMDIATILDDYSNAISEGMYEASVKISKEGADKLKHTSPMKTGEYRKGWSVKKEIPNKWSFKNTIHNKTEYRLTHLLENGHATRNGGRVSPKVHIRPVEEECIYKYERDVANIIKRGV